jgi:hypothetical protein
MCRWEQGVGDEGLYYPHEMYQPDLAILPDIVVHSPLRLERVGPPWQRPPFALEHSSEHILIRETECGYRRGVVEKVDQSIHGGCIGLEDY